MEMEALINEGKETNLRGICARKAKVISLNQRSWLKKLLLLQQQLLLTPGKWWPFDICSLYGSKEIGDFQEDGMRK
jgi:hypothetical protein